MKERPILFSAPMVQAILDGRKTQTRRVVNQKRNPHEFIGGIGEDINDPYNWGFEDNNCMGNFVVLPDQFCPHGSVGDQLWVRENTYADHETSDCITLAKYFNGAHVLHDYAPDCDPDREYKDSIAHWWYSRDCCPSIYMPRWASRIQLEITDIRVERLNDISEEDSMAEGLKAVSKDGDLYKCGIPDADGLPGNDNYGWHWHEWEVFAKTAFRKLWQKINGIKSWDDNPWVWVVEFERIKP